jgi:hypothetical protein
VMRLQTHVFIVGLIFSPLNRLKLTAHVSCRAPKRRVGSMFESAVVKPAQRTTISFLDNTFMRPLNAVRLRYALHALSNDPQMTSSGPAFISLITFISLVNTFMVSNTNVCYLHCSVLLYISCIISLWLCYCLCFSP